MTSTDQIWEIRADRHSMLLVVSEGDKRIEVSCSEVRFRTFDCLSIEMVLHPLAGSYSFHNRNVLTISPRDADAIDGIQLRSRTQDFFERYSVGEGSRATVIVQVAERETEGAIERIINASTNTMTTRFVMRSERRSVVQPMAIQQQIVTIAQNPALRFNPKPLECQGCRNYHGQTYKGVMLVCGMHPYGVEGDKCGDWEAGDDEPMMFHDAHAIDRPNLSAGSPQDLELIEQICVDAAQSVELRRRSI